jgi:hypothetical protein
MPACKITSIKAISSRLSKRYVVHVIGCLYESKVWQCLYNVAHMHGGFFIVELVKDGRRIYKMNYEY